MCVNRSIIIPAFNEAGRIGATLESVASYLGQTGTAGETEIIVVCDGCGDNTAEVARAYAGRVPLRILSYRKNRGKGYAVRKGMAASSGRVVAFMDADGSTPVHEFGRLAEPILRNEADLVVGSRRVPDAVVDVRQTLFRQALGRAFAWHAQAVLGLRIRDTQCGFKVFDGVKARYLFKRLVCNGFAFDLELLAEARECGYRVIERGVEWHEVPGSTVHPVRDGVRMLRAVWQIRAHIQTRRRYGVYDHVYPAPLAETRYGGIPS